MGPFESFMKPPFKRRSDGNISVNLSHQQRLMIEDLIGQLREMITSDHPALVRLFPGPYQDEERNQGYAVLAGAELVEKRLAAMDAVLDTVHADKLSPDELETWMRSINDLRLVLGTILDVAEDDYELPEDEAAQSMYLSYEHLGYLLERIVGALSE
ncbi:MAG: DUF2017 family protein [Microthrixaceae bacterium]